MLLSIHSMTITRGTKILDILEFELFLFLLGLISHFRRISRFSSLTISLQSRALFEVTFDSLDDDNARDKNLRHIRVRTIFIPSFVFRLISHFRSISRFSSPTISLQSRTLFEVTLDSLDDDEGRKSSPYSSSNYYSFLRGLISRFGRIAVS